MLMEAKEEVVKQVKELLPIKQSDYILRRLHSLCGIVPLGAFILFHFFANSYSHRGAPGFNFVVDTLRSMPYLAWISLSVLSIPFLFHIIFGVFIIYKGDMMPHRDQPYVRNWAYFLQRVTAVVIGIFIIWHVVYVKYILLGQDGQNYYEIMRNHFSSLGVVLWYTFVLACVAFHIANGLCTFCMTWGLTVSKHSQRVVAIVMFFVGIGLFIFGISAMSGFILSPSLYEYAPK